MSVEQNKAVAKKAIEAMVNNDWSMLDELYTSDFVIHFLGGYPTLDLNLEQIKQAIGNAPASFTEQKITIEDMIAEGDKVSIRTTVSGKHTGNFLGIEPTGKSSTAAQFTIYHIQDGKIAEMWNLFNNLGRLQQLGVIPPTEELGK